MGYHSGTLHPRIHTLKHTLGNVCRPSHDAERRQQHSSGACNKTQAYMYGKQQVLVEMKKRRVVYNAVQNKTQAMSRLVYKHFLVA